MSELKPIADAMPKLRASLGLPDDAPPAPIAEGEAFMSHDLWEQQRPDELEAARAYTQVGAYRYEELHGSLEGWVPRREFPCPGTLRILDQSTSLWPVVCDVCGYESGVPVERIDPQRLSDYRLAKAGIPEMFAGKRFEPNDAAEPVLRACREWLRGFRREPIPAVILWGQTGRGKSHLLSLMIETLVTKQNVDAIYRSASDLFDALRAAIDVGGYEAQWQRIVNARVLAIDDLGAGKVTDWTRDRFAALVDHRYSKELPLLAATNLPPGVWEREFGHRTASRLRGMALPFRLEGRDWRAQGVQQSLTEAA